MIYLKSFEPGDNLIDKGWFYSVMRTVIMYKLDLYKMAVTALKYRGMMYLIDSFSSVN
jgi:hypothetical protein